MLAGKVLGHSADIADGSLRRWEFKSLNHLVGDYYIAPRFLEKVRVDWSVACVSWGLAADDARQLAAGGAPQHLACLLHHKHLACPLHHKSRQRLAPPCPMQVALHVVKNHLADQGAFDPHVRVPLILGVWGGKGQVGAVPLGGPGQQGAGGCRATEGGLGSKIQVGAVPLRGASAARDRAFAVCVVVCVWPCRQGVVAICVFVCAAMEAGGCCACCP